MNTQTKHYKQLTQDKRYQLHALLQNDFFKQLLSLRCE
ncbi:hypothetical protein CI610_01901 [invertebrate metagenome]|uniref:Uncharacterized protein n=1 Tax=invertebrate metagenome TaxID=1711999 RepID=A0A2H9T7F5_9ZZZZ